MNEFKTYHPLVSFIYFIFIIGFSMFFMHPVCLGLSFLCGFTYSVILGGKRAVKLNLIYMLPVMITAALVNPMFNHEGITILNYLPSGNPLTLESIVYGVAAAVMILNVIYWFSCYNTIMTSDKFIYLFGRIIPSISLILSMTLRFVPKFSAQLKIVTNAQKCIGRDISSGTIIQRTKHGLSILSIMATWALESSIETADSMKSRGYGLKGRTAFSIFKFDKRDKAALLGIVILGLFILRGSFTNGIYFRYFPSMKSVEFSIWSVCVFTAYFLLCIFPIIIELLEAIRWKFIKSRI